MSSCPTLEQLEAFIAGEAPDELAAHVETCPACREQILQVRANNALLSSLVDSATHLDAARAAAEHGDTDLSIPGYEIIDERHRGGQGIVYRARQVATHRTVALKVLLAGAFATSKQRRRFEREIELVAGLAHPNIVTVYDSGVTEDGRLWFAMELLEGDTLDDYLGEAGARPWTLPDTLRLFAKICDAVSYAHQRGIIHRDLKPGNVIVDRGDEPHVLDFGLARTIDPHLTSRAAMVTVTPGFMGTLAYASPELARGDPAAVDVRSDVYALGVILYEMLTGRHPYSVTGQLSDVIETIATAPPAPMRSAAFRLDDELCTIARQALAKEPQRRYQSAAALRRDVDHYLAGEPIDAKRDSGWYVLRKTLHRYKVQAAAAAALLLLLAGFGIAMSLLYRRARAEAHKVARINVFLEDTLGSVEPAPGRDVTVHELLDESVHWIELALADEPEIEAAVRQIIGNAYRNLSLYEDADRQLAAALQTRRALFGSQHLQVASSLNALGLLRRQESRYDEAQECFQDALAIRLDVLGPDDLEVAINLANLGLLSQQTGEYDRAEQLLGESLAIRRHRLGEAHPDVAMSRFNLAELMALKGSDAEALQLHEQALAARRAILHVRHPDLARSLVATAQVHLRLGQPAQAAPLLAECLARHREVLGDDDRRTVEVQRLLEKCRAEMGDG